MSSGDRTVSDELDAKTILELFEELNEKLATKDAYGEIYVVGGAALILEYGADRRTGDVDCLINQNAEAIHDAAAEIANSRSELAADWLNETASITHNIPDEPDQGARTSFRGSNLTVKTGSPERLIAMKIHARREQDYEDIRKLLPQTAIKDGKEAKALTEYHFPHDTVTDDVVDRLDEMFAKEVQQHQALRGPGRPQLGGGDTPPSPDRGGHHLSQGEARNQREPSERGPKHGR